MKAKCSFQIINLIAEYTNLTEWIPVSIIKIIQPLVKNCIKVVLFPVLNRINHLLVILYGKIITIIIIMEATKT